MSLTPAVEPASESSPATSALGGVEAVAVAAAMDGCCLNHSPGAAAAGQAVDARPEAREPFVSPVAMVLCLRRGLECASLAAARLSLEPPLSHVRRP